MKPKIDDAFNINKH